MEGNMLSLALFFLFISSGSLFAAALFNRKYEEVLPVTCSGIILILFLFGILGNLLAGAVFVCILCTVLCAIALVYSIKSKTVLKCLRNILTPGFFVFLFFNLLFAFFMKGKMVEAWDEFTHWCDVVKVMVSLDDFGTNPASRTLYQSYPPAMSLFQYFLQKITGWITGVPLTEWKLYYAYFVLAVSYFMPVCSKIKSKPSFYILFVVCVFFMPVFFFYYYYMWLYIDGFVGLLSGAGLVMIFLNKKKSGLYTCSICLICSILVLTKDAGLLFAVFLAVLYIVDYWLSVTENGGSKRSVIFQILLAAAAILLPKLLWNINIAQNHALVQFSDKVDLAQLVNILLRKDDTYRTDVVYVFLKRFAEPELLLGRTGIYISFLALEILFLLFLAAIFGFLVKKKALSPRRAILFLLSAGLQITIYAVGLCIMYVFKFTEEEALALASFERYLGIAYLSVMSLILMSFLQALAYIPAKQMKVWAVAVTFLLWLMTPSMFVTRFFQKYFVDFSINWRGQYDEISEQIEIHTDNESRIYFLSQESDGYDYYLMRYNVRPRKITSERDDASIGVEPFYEKDIYTKIITPEQWADAFFDNYDYLAIYSVNDYFIENYSQFFRSEIERDTLYRVDHVNRCLIKCE